MQPKSDNIFWSHGKVNKAMRQERNNHKSFVIWLTGLSSSGKSTIASTLESVLFSQQLNTYILDGDNIRHGLNKNLGFSVEDRRENIRRVGEVSKLLVDAGVITLVALISPLREERDLVRAMFEEGEFIEVFVDCPIEVCEHRDPKGLYKKARAGEITQFTGISSPYEAPLHPEIVIKTNELTIEQSIAKILSDLQKRGFVPQHISIS